jgi:hypothetical protein
MGRRFRYKRGSLNFVIDSNSDSGYKDYRISRCNGEIPHSGTYSYSELQQKIYETVSPPNHFPIIVFTPAKQTGKSIFDLLKKICLCAHDISCDREKLKNDDIQNEQLDQLHALWNSLITEIITTCNFHENLQNKDFNVFNHLTTHLQKAITDCDHQYSILCNWFDKIMLIKQNFRQRVAYHANIKKIVFTPDHAEKIQVYGYLLSQMDKDDYIHIEYN